MKRREPTKKSVDEPHAITSGRVETVEDRSRLPGLAWRVTQMAPEAVRAISEISEHCPKVTFLLTFSGPFVHILSTFFPAFGTTSVELCTRGRPVAGPT